MRPKRIEVEGFTAFREPTSVDFEDTDLFVLMGPTGSGKSSLIDAMIFALYGTIPRYKDARLVAPAISQGKVEARVRLDFSVRDLNYTALRVVRRTTTGATTKEARLESGGKVLADNAKELNEKVVELLGLSFEQFTSCVVLPQGEFARFLNDKPAERQDLLVQLLGLGLYDRIRARATEMGAAHRNRLDVFVSELESLEHVTRETEKEAKAQLKALKKAQKNYRNVKSKIEEFDKDIADLRAESEQAREDTKELANLETPGMVARLTRERKRLQGEITEGKASVKRIKGQISGAEKKRKKLGNLESLVQIRGWHERRATMQEHLDDAKKQGAAAENAEQSMRQDAEIAAAARVNAEAAVHAAHTSHYVHVAREQLTIGDPCPVCGQEVVNVPRAGKPRAITTAEKALVRAEAATKKANTAHRKAEGSVASIRGVLASAMGDLGALDERLVSAPALTQIEATIEGIREADASLAQLRQKEEAVNEALEEATDELDALKDEEDDAWKLLSEKRDALSHLSPTPWDHHDLEGSWSTLTAWAKKQRPKCKESADKADEAASAAEEQVDLLLAEHEQALTDLGYEIEEYTELGEEFARVEAECSAELRTVQRDFKRKRQLVKQVGGAREGAATAETLARHLTSSRFERWLLEAAFEQLVVGASKVLHDLSSRQYSFAYNDRLEFEIVDHANADEKRSAKTLSGGETFLASLALALTLADQVADLAAHGATRLESMFLDEGFGSLDPDTLDIVASAIEELGSRGRMVGLVTHVSDLAERVPVQYRVSKGPSTATVERISH